MPDRRWGRAWAQLSDAALLHAIDRLGLQLREWREEESRAARQTAELIADEYRAGCLFCVWGQPDSRTPSPNADRGEEGKYSIHSSVRQSLFG